MSVEIITKEDLQQFRRELLEDLKTILHQTKEEHGSKKWLKSKEVRKLLKISAGTLQNLRINRSLHPSKIGGIMYYQFEEIEKLLTGEINQKT